MFPQTRRNDAFVRRLSTHFPFSLALGIVINVMRWDARWKITGCQPVYPSRFLCLCCFSFEFPGFVLLAVRHRETLASPSLRWLFSLVVLLWKSPRQHFSLCLKNCVFCFFVCAEQVLERLPIIFRRVSPPLLRGRSKSSVLPTVMSNFGS